MNIQEIEYHFFGQDQDQKTYSNLPKIAEILDRQQDKATIDVREVNEKDVSTKRENPDYLNDELLCFTDTGIKVVLATKQLAEQIKPLIPKTVKELTIPSTFLNDLSYLQTFPALETLYISDYSVFDKEEIEYIANNTTIKNMVLRSPGTFNNIKCQEDFYVINGISTIGQYKDLTLYNLEDDGNWGRSITIYTPNYKEESISFLETLYEKINNNINDVRSIKIKKNLDFVFDGDFNIEVVDKNIEKIQIQNVVPTTSAQVYKSITKYAPVKNVIYKVENKTYEDIDRLRPMSKTTNLSLQYQSGCSSTKATYEEFLGMRATIDYYKELLKDLSPAEKTAYVFDILKTMRYSENYQNASRARNIHSIIEDGNIVCVGYSEFAKQLLNEVGVKCISESVTCIGENSEVEHHQRNFVRIDDDKYNIHGLYAMDITWDSDKDITIIKDEDGKELVIARPPEDQQEQIIDKYDSLVLYRHFLIPMETYEQRYPNEINPSLYDIYKNKETTKLINENRRLLSGKITASSITDINTLSKHKELFDDTEGVLTVEKYWNAQKPTLETFEQILTNVRKAQGYTEEEATNDVERVVELHQMLADQNPDSPNHFFKPREK